MSDIGGPHIPSRGLRSAFEVINRMVSDGIIRTYAVTDAVAALNYLEPVMTSDLDILVSLEEFDAKSRAGLVILDSVFGYLQKAGYTEFRYEGIVIEGWPVQFLPVASDLDREGLAQAIEVELEDSGGGELRVRMLRAEHIVANALRVGRPKDKIRIGQFLDEDAVDLAALSAVLDRHGLRAPWAHYCAETGRPDPYPLKSEP
jgi:hypothetical protein